MKTISSRDNPLYKQVKQLAASSQVRRKAGHTLLDGVHLCQAYLQHCGIPPQCIINETALSHPEVKVIVAQCEAGRATCITLPDALFDVLSQVERGVGILFVIDIPVIDDFISINYAGADGMKGSIVLLDSIQDPGNLGSILRSAAAAGIKNVYCSQGTALSWSPKVLRAGMGAHFLLTIIENVDLLSLIKRLEMPVLATSSHVPQCVYDIDLRQSVAWLFGHEGQGVADALLALATHQVAIPHQSMMESLNVAACAAVCFFEQLRQNRT
jgi:TrmH family RNA methyltransferase